MDLQKLFNSYETLLMQMKEDGYSENYIKSVRFEINWIKRNPKLLQCTSYLELYEERLKTGRNPESSQERIYRKRSLFTILQRFEENNEFPNHHKKVPLVQKSAYSKLRCAFKELVDYYKWYAIQNDHSVNTITKCVSKASCFLLHLQRSGHDSLETVTERDVISFFTDDNGVLCRSRSYRKDVESVLTAAEPLNPLTKKIRLFLPAIKKRRQNIQYFTQEESLRLRDTLENGATVLTKRDLAIGKVPAKLKKEPTTYVPHAFTKEELQRFFHECDNIPVNRSLLSKVRHLTCPVFFRLLYSSGIRTTEARFLRKADFDPIEGVLNIQKSKGYDQHYVALHKSMSALLIRYDQTIDKLLPDRTFFFEKHNGGHYSRDWVTQTFHTLWQKANTATGVVPYALRHNYATENINGWTGNDSFGLNEHLLYLSKSMGHRNLSSTLYYYSIVPRFADILLEKTEMGLNKIVPEVTYEKE